jgi:hypothetical protein
VYQNLNKNIPQIRSVTATCKSVAELTCMWLGCLLDVAGAGQVRLFHVAVSPALSLAAQDSKLFSTPRSVRNGHIKLKLQ